jgi:hypothetical protein
MFNPDLAVTAVDLGSGHRGVMVDDALVAPHQLVALAVTHRQAFAEPSDSAYPGIELPLPPSAVEQFVGLFGELAGPRLGVSQVLSAYGRLAMVTRPPEALNNLQRLCHRDRLFVESDQRAVAAVLYLFDDERLGGTNFFEPNQSAEDTEQLMQRWGTMDAAVFRSETGCEPGYLTQSSRHFTLRSVIPPRWNRLIFYDGGQFHGSHIEHPELLNDDPARGRLTLNLFMLCIGS